MMWNIVYDKKIELNNHCLIGLKYIIINYCYMLYISERLTSVASVTSDMLLLSVSATLHWHHLSSAVPLAVLCYITATVTFFGVWDGSAHGTNTCEMALWPYRQLSYQCQLVLQYTQSERKGEGNVAWRRMDGCTELVLNVTQCARVYRKHPCVLRAGCVCLDCVFSTEIWTQTQK